MENKDIGDWLRERVKSLMKGMAQKELAECLGGDGGVTRFLKGKRKPNPELRTLKLLADFFHMTLPEFLGGSPPIPDGSEALFSDLAAVIKSQNPKLIGSVEFVIQKAADDARRELRETNRKARSPTGARAS